MSIAICPNCPRSLPFTEPTRPNGVEKALKEFETAIPEEKNRKGNIGFRVRTEGYRIHEKPAVLKEVIAKYEVLQEANYWKVGRKGALFAGRPSIPWRTFLMG